MSQGYQWFAAFDLKIFKSSNWKVVLVLDKQDEIPHQLKVESKTFFTIPSHTKGAYIYLTSIFFESALNIGP